MTFNPDQWPEVVDVLVATPGRSDSGLFTFYVQTPTEDAIYRGNLDARSMRASLIEMTSWLASLGYHPTERWDANEDDAERRFRRSPVNGAA